MLHQDIQCKPDIFKSMEKVFCIQYIYIFLTTALYLKTPVLLYSWNHFRKAWFYYFLSFCMTDVNTDRVTIVNIHRLNNVAKLPPLLYISACLFRESWLLLVQTDLFLFLSKAHFVPTEDSRIVTF